MKKINDALAWIAKATTLADLRQLEANAKRIGEDSIVAAAQARISELLAGSIYEDTLFYLAGLQALHPKHNPMSYSRRGLASRIAEGHTPDEAARLTLLKQMEYPLDEQGQRFARQGADPNVFTGYAVVLRHKHLFPAWAVEKAEAIIAQMIALAPASTLAT